MTGPLDATKLLIALITFNADVDPEENTRLYNEYIAEAGHRLGAPLKDDLAKITFLTALDEVFYSELPAPNSDVLINERRSPSLTFNPACAWATACSQPRTRTRRSPPSKTPLSTLRAAYEEFGWSKNRRRECKHRVHNETTALRDLVQALASQVTDLTNEVKDMEKERGRGRARRPLPTHILREDRFVPECPMPTSEGCHHHPGEFPELSANMSSAIDHNVKAAHLAEFVAEEMQREFHDQEDGEFESICQAYGNCPEINKGHAASGEIVVHPDDPMHTDIYARPALNMSVDNATYNFNKFLIDGTTTESENEDARADEPDDDVGVEELAGGPPPTYRSHSPDPAAAAANAPPPARLRIGGTRRGGAISTLALSMLFFCMFMAATECTEPTFVESAFPQSSFARLQSVFTALPTAMALPATRMVVPRAFDFDLFEDDNYDDSGPPAGLIEFDNTDNLRIRIYNFWALRGEILLYFIDLESI
ncbi:hypothetical protein CYMTET_32922 [Cymbomonas tetramitiformis]|uniref:Uncharacterized protein n=1 Tax=Cymbomonas tetramitiformis TaxID=36881 RepID=A0AAE0FE35_9CHLO|nr:hypothetical protein CYMTET_32922 [Cymbomonas tetramitiformis]